MAVAVDAGRMAASCNGCGCDWWSLLQMMMFSVLQFLLVV